MDSNKLKLNNDKTEALVVGTRFRTSVCYSEHLEIGGSPIPFQPNVKSLWVVLDSSLTMSHHISSVCRSAYLELCRISPIHPFLTTSATAALVCSRVLSQIDYCNSLLAGIQKMLNNSAQLIFNKKRTEHVTPMLISLHWLIRRFDGKPMKWYPHRSYMLSTLTFGTVSPHTLPTDLFDHLLTNCSVSHVLTWKVPVQGLSNIRRLVCGTLFWYKPDFQHLSHLLNPASKCTSSAMPSLESQKLSP